jgi:hypothetical protein
MRSDSFVCLFVILGSAMLAAQSNTVPLINRSVPSNVSSNLPKPDPKTQGKILESYGKLPLSFERNQGQIDARVKFLSRGSGYTLFLTSDEAVFNLRGIKSRDDASDTGPQLRSSPAVPTTNAVLRMKLVKANPAANVTGTDELAGTSNYFIGNDPAKWRTNVPAYAKVKYEGIYSGIDLLYYGNQRQLEYDFVVAPGADPRRIAFDVRGAKQIRQDRRGDLVLKMGEGEVRWHKPVVYQEKGGIRQEITAHYVIRHRNRVGFEVADYDLRRPLFIDPLIYSTYLGGSGQDLGLGIAVDSSGNAYVTGWTLSTDFPTTNPLQASNAGDSDAFVTKINPTGSALVYSTYLGGNGSDYGYSIAVDSPGNAYVTGYTFSPNFPVTLGAFQTTLNGDAVDNAFVTKINPTGSALVYSTYLGGDFEDLGVGIAVDSSGDAYVTGAAKSGDFPVTPGAFQTTCDISEVQTCAFVTKFNLAGSALVYSTYLGGGGVDAVNDGSGIAVDSSGNAYVTGATSSPTFPVTPGAFQTTLNGAVDNAFVTKIDPSGSALVYSTYLGGSGVDDGSGIAVDSSGNAYVTGATSSPNFPVTPGAFQTTLNGADNAFVTKINPTGSALVYSTYLGGSGQDLGLGIALDGTGDAYVTGITSSTSFPTMNPLQPAYGGGAWDAFVAKINRAGSALVYSTYLGGNGSDYGYGIAVDHTGNAYVIGNTLSPNFPVTLGAFQTTYGGDQDAFVAKIASKVTFASLINLVKQFETKRVVAATMVAMLKRAQAAEREHDPKLADALLHAFIDEVSEQSGKSLTAAQAAILIQDAEALMIRHKAI